MPYLIPDAGIRKILENLTNKTAPENLIVRLFRNNYTPVNTSVASDFTEAVFPGYAAFTMLAVDWNAAAARSIVSAAQKVWTCSGVSTDDIYGYYIQQATSGVVILAERDSGAPTLIRNSGDIIRVTPSVTG